MDYSPTAATLFRDLGGLSAMIERLGKELLSDSEQLQEGQQQQAATGMNADQAAAAAASAGSQLGADNGKQPAAYPAASVVSGTQEVPAASAADGTPTQGNTVTYAKRLLLKSLLRAIALASYAPGTGRCTSKACTADTLKYSQRCMSLCLCLLLRSLSKSVCASAATLLLSALTLMSCHISMLPWPAGARPQEEEQDKLYACLRQVISRGWDYGGSLFALAASMVTDLIHHDPLCYRTLDAAGLPEAFLTAVQVSCNTGMLHMHLLLN